MAASARARCTADGSQNVPRCLPASPAFSWDDACCRMRASAPSRPPPALLSLWSLCCTAPSAAQPTQFINRLQKGSRAPQQPPLVAAEAAAGDAHVGGERVLRSQARTAAKADEDLLAEVVTALLPSQSGQDEHAELAEAELAEKQLAPTCAVAADLVAGAAPMKAVRTAGHSKWVEGGSKGVAACSADPSPRTAAMSCACCCQRKMCWRCIAGTL